jgi:5-methylcytosine-specific restriction endonuclease McrA
MIFIIMNYSTFKARQKWYRDVYLLSEHWKVLRKAKLTISPQCEICGKKRRLDVHHLRYKNIYDVLVEDLQTLCRRCHKKHHKKHHKKTNKVRDFIKRHKRHKWLV